MEKRILGIEFGSTRIKAVLIDEKANVLAQGSYEWENVLVDGLWSYPLSEVEKGLQTSYADLIKNYGQPLKSVDAIGVSAMMHGYLVFDKDDNLLAPFRTWRNTNTGEAASQLSSLFNFNVPLRWSVSQYYQSVLDGLSHVKDIAYLTTLSGYVHYRLTGKRVLGVDDASGIFPVKDGYYDTDMLAKFNDLLKSKGVDVKFETLLPDVLVAGECAGYLTEEGARWMDVSGSLSSGIVLCPPEGDMGTGMIATNCVSPREANISSGTSANLTVILEKPLESYYPEIDVIATPSGYPAALVHANNCTTEINEWVNMLGEAASLMGAQFDKNQLFTKLFKASMDSDPDVGEIATYNFLAGEPLAGTRNGAPVVVRRPGGKMTLANFMQAQIYSAIATLKLGVDILEKEGVKIDSVLAHGGFYKTDFVGQNATSAVLNAPVTVMKTAAEGGAWGMAVLALYVTDNQKPLNLFLNDVFAGAEKKVVEASEQEKEKCARFMENYRKFMKAEQVASLENK